MAGAVERGLLRRFPDSGDFDREEADGVALRAEPGGAEVGGDRSEQESGGSGTWRRGLERGGGLGEDGVAEAGEEAGVGGMEREMEGTRRGGGARAGGASWGRVGEKGEEGEIFGEGGGAEGAGEGDALGAERAAEGGGGGRRRGGGREGGDAGAAEGVATREDARHDGGVVEGGEAHRTLRRLRFRRWRRRGARHGRRFCSELAVKEAGRGRPPTRNSSLCGNWEQ